MNEFYNRHYIIIDARNRITDAWSDGPHYDRETDGAVCINKKGGYQFRLSPDGEENPVIVTMDGIPMYKWDGEKVIKRTDEEIEADRAELPAPEPDAMTRTQLAVAELAQVVEDNNTLNQLAIAELAEAITGGENNG